MSRFALCRWISCEDKAQLKSFIEAHNSAMSTDIDGDPVFMAPSAYSLRYDGERNPQIVFADVKDYQKSGAGK